MADVTDALPDLPEHAAENRRHWNGMADRWVEMGERAWAGEPSWGEWGIPEAELQLLPDDLAGRRAVELGCGTAYVSAWLARRGADVVGVDVSEVQLATARRLADEHGVELTLHHASAEAVPEPDGSFDFAISEYGAAIWCDPERWLPEAYRLLRPGGELVFLGNHPLVALCSPVDGTIPVTERLERPYRSLGRLDWRDAVDEPGGIEFNPTFAAWIDVIHRSGFAIVRYLELYAPDDADGAPFVVPATWARRHPAEHVWHLRRAA